MPHVNGDLEWRPLGKQNSADVNKLFQKLHSQLRVHGAGWGQPGMQP